MNLIIFENKKNNLFLTKLIKERKSIKKTIKKRESKKLLFPSDIDKIEKQENTLKNIKQAIIRIRSGIRKRTQAETKKLLKELKLEVDFGFNQGTNKEWEGLLIRLQNKKFKKLKERKLPQAPKLKKFRKELRQANFRDVFNFKTESPKVGVFKFIKDFKPAINSSDISRVIDFSRTILTIKRGFDRNSRFIIKLLGKKSNEQRTFEQRMNSGDPVEVNNMRAAFNSLITKVLQFTSDGEYNFDIDQVTITVIPQIGGGCCSGKREKIITFNNMKLVSYPIKNNNCFFACVKKQIGEKKLGKRVCNLLRDKLSLEHNKPITPSKAIDLFKIIRSKKHYQLQIIDTNEGREYKTEDEPKTVENNTNNKIILLLIDDHYSLMRSRTNLKVIYPKCSICNDEHDIKKKCKESSITTYNRKKEYVKYKRYLKGKDPDSFECLNNDCVIHYDLESHHKNKINEHIPYINGFVFPSDNSGCSKFEYFTGRDCVEKFIRKVLEYADKQYTIVEKNCFGKIRKCKMKKKIYVNAYNGANFDHYFSMKEILKIIRKEKIEIKKFVMNGGSIFRIGIKNIEFIDLCKHTQGSLKDNLESLGCNYKKGDFDHEKGNDWDKMGIINKGENGEKLSELQKSCIDYLKIDVMGLKELYEKMNEALHKEHGVNIHTYYSTSHTTFDLWKKTLMEGDKIKTFIKLPSCREENIFRPAVFGGRCYPSKKQFESVQLEKYFKGEIEFEQVEDYLMDLDVVSLYPSVMKLFKYPVGKTFEMTINDLRYFNKHLESKTTLSGNQKGKCQFMGIYYIKYIPNKYLAHAILPNREPTGLKWTLKSGEGYYTSVDIENAIKYGYDVKMIAPKSGPLGFYWKKGEYIFEEYIDKLFDKKKNAERGSPERALAKLMMNGLYGKMIQRPIPINKVWCKSLTDFWKFYKNNSVQDIEIIDEQMYVTGLPRDEIELERSNTKPTHLGAFILSYTRKLMIKYYNESNPYFDISSLIKNSSSKNEIQQYRQLQKENDFYYTDTDAIQVHSKNIDLLGTKKTGIKLSKELGGIDDDLQEYGNSTKIVRGLWIAPKLYMLGFITNDSHNPLSEKDKELIKKGKCDIRIVTRFSGNQKQQRKIYYLYRGKGVPTNKLNVELFKRMNDKKSISMKRDFAMKKNGVNLNQPQKEKGINTFSITHLSSDDTERVLNKKPWSGRKWEGNNSSCISNNH